MILVYSLPSYFSTIHFNIILPPKPRSSRTVFDSRLCRSQVTSRCLWKTCVGWRTGAYIQLQHSGFGSSGGGTQKQLFVSLYIHYICGHSHRLVFFCVGDHTGRSNEVPIPVPARSKACNCGRSLDGITGSIPAGGMDDCLLGSVVCCQVERSLRRAYHASKRSPTECGVSECDWGTSYGRPRSARTVQPQLNRQVFFVYLC
jgi:hypothetical protein